MADLLLSRHSGGPCARCRLRSSLTHVRVRLRLEPSTRYARRCSDGAFA
jgi:hypothetical protein